MKTVKIDVKKANNGYVLAVDFDRYRAVELTTVHKSRDELDARIIEMLDELDKADEEDG